MSKYPSTNITYSGLEDKGLTVTILDEKKNKWTIWKKDYDNPEQDSDAWSTLQNYKIGEGFGVEYSEKPESFTNREGKTINFTRRTIFKILPLVSHPTQISAPGKSTNLGHSGASQRASGSVGGRNYDQEGYEKCLWNYFTEVAQGDLDRFGFALTESIPWDAFQAIKADSRTRFSPLREAVARHAPKVLSPEEDLPVIQQNEEDEHDDIAKDIPF